MVEIRRHMAPQKAINGRTSGTGNPVTYIVIHETDNPKPGADASAHARLQYNYNPRNASWHYQVDDKEVVQSFEDNIKCHHAGNGSFNANSIGIEICVNSDGNFRKAVENAAALTKMLMKKHNVPKSRVVQHNRASGKNCPRNLRSGAKGVNWNDFLAMLDGTPVKVEAPSKVAPAVSKPVSGKPNFNTNSLVDFLKSVNEKSDFASRKALAAKHGISNYSGTAAQNESLLAKLKAAYKNPAPAPKAPSKPSYPKGDMKTTSIVEYLKSIKVDSSFANRKKLAAQYGISGYSGTAAQNTKLLSLMRGGTTASAPVKKNKYAGGDRRTTSVVDYLKSIKVDSSFANRKKIAAELGIKGYEGTAAQNAELLKRMRG